VFFIAAVQGRVVPARNGADRFLPGLAAAVLKQLPVETIVDGEAVVGVNGRLDLAELQEADALTSPRPPCPRRPAAFLVVRRARPRQAGPRRPPLSQRGAQLTDVMASCRPPLQQVPFPTVVSFDTSRSCLCVIKLYRAGERRQRVHPGGVATTDSRVAGCETTQMLGLAAHALRPCQVEDLVAFSGGDRGDTQFAGRTLVLPGSPGDGRSVGRSVAEED
jgi:hypothetical protein